MSRTFTHTVPVLLDGRVYRATVDYSVSQDPPNVIENLKVVRFTGPDVGLDFDTDKALEEEITETILGGGYIGLGDHRVAYDVLLDHAGRVLQRAVEPPLTDVIEKPIREAYEAWWRETFGSPPSPLRTGMETVPADYGNFFLWFDRHPVHTETPPSYYHRDCQETYVVFRAGWQAAQALRPSAP